MVGSLEMVLLDRAVAFIVGGALAAFRIGFLAERYGRKWAIAWSAIITSISGALLAGSVNATSKYFAGYEVFLLPG